MADNKALQTKMIKGLTLKQNDIGVQSVMYFRPFLCLGKRRSKAMNRITRKLMEYLGVGF